MQASIFGERRSFESLIDILIATRNRGKIAEISRFFQKQKVKIHDLNSLDIKSSPDEPYDSFMMNSFYKANYYSQYTGMITLSDDSGLEVKCLDNQPGVYSARYGGIDLSDKERNNFLISNLPADAVNPEAKFKCVLTLYLKNRWAMFFEGSSIGNISRIQKGTQGHGYDPIFYVPDQFKTFGELDISVKNLISHRAKALNKLSIFIDDNFNL